MTVTHTAGGVAHFDVTGPDTAALERFYGTVLDWQMEPRGPGYTLVRTPQGSADGAIAEDDEASLTIGVVVADLEAAVQLATEHGGTVVMPPTDNGWVTKARITDPAGNALTLIQG